MPQGASRGRWRRLVFAGAVAIVAAASGAVAGSLASATASALAAMLVVGGAGGAWWLRRQVNELRSRHIRTRREVERLLEMQQQTAAKLDRLAGSVVAVEDSVQQSLTRTEHRVSKAVDKRGDAATRYVSKVTTLEGERTRRHADQLFRQAESLHNLHRLLEVRGAVSPSRGWALSPDLLLTYVEEILSRKPACVVECGSGLSTVWAAYALEALGGCRQVIALDHELEFSQQTRSLLAEHRLSAFAEVRHAPLTDVALPDGTWRWYDPATLDGIGDVGVVLIDGPPKATGEQARYPALPVLRPLLAPGAVILADDTRRPDEQAIVQRWCAEWPELCTQTLQHEKGAVRLTTPQS